MTHVSGVYLYGMKMCLPHQHLTWHPLIAPSFALKLHLILSPLGNVELIGVCSPSSTSYYYCHFTQLCTPPSKQLFPDTDQFPTQTSRLCRLLTSHDFALLGRTPPVSNCSPILMSFLHRHRDRAASSGIEE